MSTTYYIVNKRIEENKKVEYKNLLNLIDKINNVVNMYCIEGRLSTNTLDDIKNSLSTWRWFIDDEYGRYAFLYVTVNQYKFKQYCDEGCDVYSNIYTLEQALQFVQNDEDYYIEDEYGSIKTIEEVIEIVSKRQSGN